MTAEEDRYEAGCQFGRAQLITEVIDAAAALLSVGRHVEYEQGVIELITQSLHLPQTQREHRGVREMLRLRQEWSARATAVAGS